MRKTFIVLLLSVLSVSLFAFVKTPILSEDQLIEVKGTIESTQTTSGRFFYLNLKGMNDFKAIFPNFPKLANWFEKNTDITLEGYYVELKTGKYFVPVKVTYKEKSFDLRKEIARKLYARKKMLYYKQKNRRPYNYYHMYPEYPPNMMNKPNYYNYTPGLPRYPRYNNIPYTPNPNHNYYPRKKLPPIK